MKKKNWFLWLIFFGANVYFVTIALTNLDDFGQWTDRSFQNSRPSFQVNRPFETGFRVDHFPGEYQEMIPTIESWSLVWYELPEKSGVASFQDAQLENHWIQIGSLMQERHPIINQSIPEDAFASLSKLQEMRTLEEAFEFTILVGEIEYGKLALWQNSSWVEAKQTWEARRTQAMILGIYLLFLEGKSDIDMKIHEEIDDLISTVGTKKWFQDFSDHLNTWWGEE